MSSLNLKRAMVDDDGVQWWNWKERGGSWPVSHAIGPTSKRSYNRQMNRVV